MNIHNTKQTCFTINNSVYRIISALEKAILLSTRFSLSFSDEHFCGVNFLCALFRRKPINKVRDHYSSVLFLHLSGANKIYPEHSYYLKNYISSSRALLA